MAKTKKEKQIPLQATQLHLKVGQLMTIDQCWFKIIGMQPETRVVILKGLTPEELMAEQKLLKDLEKLGKKGGPSPAPHR